MFRMAWVAAFCAGAAGWSADVLITGPVPGDLKVPSRAKIGEADAIEERDVSDLCGAVVAEREKKTGESFQKIKAQTLERLKKEEDERKDKERRQQLYEKHWGSESGKPEKEAKKEAEKPAPKPPPAPAKPVLVNVPFLVPEIQVYETAAKVSRERQALAKLLVDALPRLDLNNDGLLKDDEYKQASALFISTEKLLLPLDLDKDGALSLDEIGAQKLPTTIEEAVSKGTGLVGKEYKIRGYDDNDDGALDITERKALSMAFASAGLAYGKDATFYDQAASGLLARRAMIAFRFEKMEVRP